MQSTGEPYPVRWCCMPLHLPDLFIDETHPLARTATTIVERHYRPDRFPATTAQARDWRYRLGVMMADQLLQEGFVQEAYTLRLHATEIELSTAALYNAWILSLDRR